MIEFGSCRQLLAICEGAQQGGRDHFVLELFL